MNLANQTATGIGVGWKSIENFVADDGTVFGPNVNALWSFGPPASVDVSYLIGATTTNIGFSGFTEVVGGNKNDTYLILASADIDDVTDIGGFDTLSYANRTTSVEVTIDSLAPLQGKGTNIEDFAGIDSIVGGSAADSLSVANGSASTVTWSIDQAGGGTLNSQLKFANFENLIGGSQSDIFSFSPTGSISSVLGGAGRQDTIFGPTLSDSNSVIQWLINSTGGGNWNGTNKFAGIENITAGTGKDKFEITNSGKLAGLLDAGDGDNILSYMSFTSSISVNFASASPTATNISLIADKFSIVIGGAGNDTIKGSNLRGMVLVGNGGNDNITGGTRNDILIGGLGSDILYGGAGQDIVVGGRLSFDNDLAGLLSILTVWRTSSDYDVRVNQLATANNNFSLSNGGGGLPDTLLDDGSVDRVFGGSASGDTDLDWLIAATNDLTPDWDGNTIPNPKERRTRP